jgi:hypothetical protein
VALALAHLATIDKAEGRNDEAEALIKRVEAIKQSHR